MHFISPFLYGSLVGVIVIALSNNLRKNDHPFIEGMFVI